jgi:hypothetical protein
VKLFYASFLSALRWLFLFMGCLRLLASPAHATSVAPNPPTATSAPSLATVLNPDGTLRAGAQGSFDARRFVLHTASDGRPQFSPASVTGAGDEGWQDGFYLSGTDDIVFAVAQLGTDIYVGGRFTTVGGITANHIAKWNGTTWSSLGTGATNGVDYRAGSQSSVLALAVLGTDHRQMERHYVEQPGYGSRHGLKWKYLLLSRSRLGPLRGGKLHPDRRHNG